MLKCQFHTHSAGDPMDFIPYTPKELIDEASKLNYDVLSITCHRKVVFNEELRNYAEEKGILLMPGIEFEIGKKQILGINIDQEIEQVRDFNDLKKYRETHPDCLIIAPHPYFPGKVCLKESLEENIDLFDAIEISFCYRPHINFNKKAAEIAKKHNKPLLATADCHRLEYLNTGYFELDADKNIKSIIQSIQNKKIKNHTSPISWYQIIKFFITVGIGNLTNKAR